MNRYRLKVGLHFGPGFGPTEKKFVPGDIVTSAEDLVAKFPNKFELVGEAAPAAPALVTTPTPTPTKAEATASGLGTDATNEFADAAKADLLVLARGELFFVADTDEPNKALNDKALKRNEVSPFIAKYLKK